VAVSSVDVLKKTSVSITGGALPDELLETTGPAGS
jgi:hypothetical protein